MGTFFSALESAKAVWQKPSPLVRIALISRPSSPSRFPDLSGGELMTKLMCGAIAFALPLIAPSLGAQDGGQRGQEGARNPMAGWNEKAPWGPRQRLGSSAEYLRDPFRIFDNVYYVGLHSVSSYLVTTSAGLVLIDATYPETPDAVLSSVRKAGLDPLNIKYVLVTHSHIDHFGGAGRIQQVTGARIGMSAEDWDNTAAQQGRGGQRGQNVGIPLTRDLVLRDNGTLTVGDTTFKFYVTPGHTPGATSVEFQAKDGGKSYRVLAPGGMGLSFGPEWTPVFIKSMERLKQLGPWDVILGNHPFLMPRDLEQDVEKDLATRGNGPHPAVVGAAKINEWFDQVLKVVNEKLVSEQAAKTGR
jgi:metallo-beta-lactamase class B